MEMGSLPMPAATAEESARSHKVFVMLLPYYHSSPQLQYDIMSIRGEGRSIKHSPQPSEKGPKSIPPFLAQGPILSRYVTKIRGLGVRASNHDKIYIIVNKLVSRFIGGEGAQMKDSLAMLLKTNGGKMSVFASRSMLMKINDLFFVLSRY